MFAAITMLFDGTGSSGHYSAVCLHPDMAKSDNTYIQREEGCSIALPSFLMPWFSSPKEFLFNEMSHFPLSP